MKQIDRIRNMNAKELADEIVKISPVMIRCKFCYYANIGQRCTTGSMSLKEIDKYCVKGIEMWLESEVEE